MSDETKTTTLADCKIENKVALFVGSFGITNEKTNTTTTPTIVGEYQNQWIIGWKNDDKIPSALRHLPTGKNAKTICPWWKLPPEAIEYSFLGTIDKSTICTLLQDSSDEAPSLGLSGIGALIGLGLLGALLSKTNKPATKVRLTEQNEEELIEDCVELTENLNENQR